MDEKPYRVYVVVDPHYGERLRDLPMDEPIWVVDSIKNHPIIQALWSEHNQSNYLEGITSFTVDTNGNPEDWFLTELSNIDLHHGEYSHVPPYTILEVIGIEWSDKIGKALREYGFDSYELTSEGFRTRRELRQ